jgi:hypothetical protein
MIVRAGDDLSWWSFLVVGREGKKGLGFFLALIAACFRLMHSARLGNRLAQHVVDVLLHPLRRNSFLLGAVPFFEFVLGVLGRPPGAVQMRRQYRSGLKKPRIFHRLSLFCMVGKFVVNCHCSSPSVQCGKNPYSEAAAQTKKLQTFASSNCSYPNPP